MADFDLARRTADQYFVWLSTLMGITGARGRRSRASSFQSTVPRVVFNLRVLQPLFRHCRPLVVGKPDCRLPVDVRGSMRARRWGRTGWSTPSRAHDLYGGDLIVVDFGTATTFDVVDHDGAYVGGVIAPGVNLSLEALHQAAAALAACRHHEAPARVIGTNTVACMQSGVFWGYVGLDREICAASGRTRPPDEGHRHRGAGAAVPAGRGLFDAFDET